MCSNIWSHALPAASMLALLVTDRSPVGGAHTVLSFSFLSILCCFLGSCCYHTFMADHRRYYTFLKMDVSGLGGYCTLPQAGRRPSSRICALPMVVWCQRTDATRGCTGPEGLRARGCAQVCGVLLVLVGNGFATLHYGLWCHSALRLAYLAAYTAACAACVHASLTAGSARRRAAAMLVLMLVRASALALRAALMPTPAASLRHFAWMEVRPAGRPAGSGSSCGLCVGGATGPSEVRGQPRVLRMPRCMVQACSLAGGAVNALRVPERWLQPRRAGAPAPLDCVLNSHQIMHCLVALAMLHLHLGLSLDARFVSELRAGGAQCSDLLPPPPLWNS
jgi:hypothetical protein